MAISLMNFYYSITGFGENIHHSKEGLQVDCKGRREVTSKKMLPLLVNTWSTFGKKYPPDSP
jgi:hypothetical protein